jgi:alpha-N-arabinofuranosidase
MITIAIVNRDSKEAIDVKINAKVTGSWTAHELNAPSIDAVNTLKGPNVVDYKQRTVSSKNYTIAAHSIAILQARV